MRLRWKPLAVFVVLALVEAGWCQQAVPTSGTERGSGPANHALAFFDFDSPAPVDASNHGVAARLIGAPLWAAAGHEGGALEFDGDDAVRVELNINPGFDQRPQLTMGAFVRVDEITGTHAVISCDNGDWDRSLLIQNGRWSLFKANGATTAGALAQVSEQWVFVAAVYDGPENRGYLYVDGHPVLETGLSNPCGVGQGFGYPFVEIGRSPGFGQGFKGAIDNVFFFEGILSAEQLDRIRTRGRQSILEEQPLNDERSRFRVDGYQRWPEDGEWVLPCAQTDILPAATWSYKTTEPPAGWEQPAFDDSTWLQGPGGFGEANQEVDRIGTHWNGALGSRTLWLRREFSLTAQDLAEMDGSPLAIWGRWDNWLDLYVNGVPTVVQAGMNRAYRYLPFDDSTTQSLHVGRNVVAAKVHNSCGTIGYADLAIVRNPYDGMPHSGASTNSLTEQFLYAARRFAAEYHVPMLSFAVVRNGSIVSNYSIGHLDPEQERPAPQHTYCRTASINKPITAGAYKKLFSMQYTDPLTGMTLAPESKFLPLVAARGVAAFPGTDQDVAFKWIPLQSMIDHRSGIRRSFNASTEEVWAIAGVDPQDFGNKEYVSYAVGMPLLDMSFRNGVSSSLTDSSGMSFLHGPAYSNVAYACLVAAITLLKPFDLDYYGFVEEHLISAADQGLHPMIRTQELPSRRPENEAWYRTRSWPIEKATMYTIGSGTSMTAATYTKFLSEYLLPKGQPIPPGINFNWTHVGAGYGARTMARQWVSPSQGVTGYCILTNQPEFGLAELRGEFDSIVYSLGPNDWN